VSVSVSVSVCRYMLLTQLTTCCFSALSIARYSWKSWKRIRATACWWTMMAMLVTVVSAGMIGVVPGLAGATKVTVLSMLYTAGETVSARSLS